MQSAGSHEISPTTPDNPPVSGLELIRGLEYSDLPGVLAIERRSFTAPWSLAMFVLELSKPSGICLAALSNGELSAYLVCARYVDVFHLMNLAVAPEWRGRGIAEAMVNQLLDRAGRDSRYTLEVRVSNHAAIRMYERFGFRSAGRRRRYYHDNREDALIMWRGTPDA